MADEADIASEREEALRKAALSAVPRPAQAGNGVCRWCNCPIEKDRLAALPCAAHCAECASEIEDARARIQRRGF